MVFLLYLLLGACAGVLAGLFGVGGGLIIVPVLVFSFTAQGFDSSILTHLAVGTSLGTIVFTSLNAVREHHKRGAVRWDVVGWMSLGVGLGAALGALTADALQGVVLQKIIGVFAILMAAQMAFAIKPKGQGQLPGKVGLAAAGSIIGWASAIFGIGGGSLTVPFLHAKGVVMQQAVATSSAVGLPIALAGALSFIVVGLGANALPDGSSGYVYWPALIGIALTSMYFTRFGVRLAHHLPANRLKQLFALLLVCVGTSFLV